MLMLHQKYRDAVKLVDKDYKYKPEGDNLIEEDKSEDTPEEPAKVEEEEEQEL